MSIPPLAVGILWIAVILGITAVAFVLVRKLARPRGVEGASANEMLSHFRELYERGGLSDQEFRHIKSRLGPQLQVEASDATGAGSIAEASAALRGAAEAISGDWREGGEGIGDQRDGAERSEGEDRVSETDSSNADEGAGGGGCDADPPNGGDSNK